MRVLWLTNSPLYPLRNELGYGNPSSGTWLDACYDQFKIFDVELTVITFISNNAVVRDGKCTLYALPTSIDNSNLIRVLSNVKIDIVMLWGTEYKYGLRVFSLLKNIPKVIYMQGIVSDIGKNYLSGITSFQIIQNTTLRDIIRNELLWSLKHRFLKQSKVEQKYLEMAGNVIVENEWCSAYCKIAFDRINIYYSKLPISKDFYDVTWKYENVIPYSIMCNSPSHPLKGFHFLLKAIAIVVKFYPNVRVFVPGSKRLAEKPNFFEKFKMQTYSLFIRREVKRLKLTKCIEFMHDMSPNEMAFQMSKSNVFVMPSNVENHSSTLIEALIVGTPSVASYTGGVPEFINHGNNGFLYRYEEYEMLAFYIMELFGKNDLAERISINGRDFARSRWNLGNIGNDLVRIYGEIISNSIKKL